MSKNKEEKIVNLRKKIDLIRTFLVKKNGHKHVFFDQETGIIEELTKNNNLKGLQQIERDFDEMLQLLPENQYAEIQRLLNRELGDG